MLLFVKMRVRKNCVFVQRYIIHILIKEVLIYVVLLQIFKDRILL